MQPSVAWIDHIDRQFILGHKHARSRLVNAFYNYIYQAGKSALENNVFRTKAEFALNTGCVGGVQNREIKIL